MKEVQWKIILFISSSTKTLFTTHYIQKCSKLLHIRGNVCHSFQRESEERWEHDVKGSFHLLLAIW